MTALSALAAAWPYASGPRVHKLVLDEMHVRKAGGKKETLTDQVEVRGNEASQEPETKEGLSAERMEDRVPPIACPGPVAVRSLINQLGGTPERKS